MLELGKCELKNKGIVHREKQSVSSNTSRRSEKNLGVSPAIVSYVVMQEIHIQTIV